MAQVQEAIVRLVDRFDQNRDAYLSGSYNETQLRREWCLSALLRIIDPLFEALGWDFENRQGSAMSYRDSNIKCGNSLIDSDSIAASKAAGLTPTSAGSTP